MLGRIFGDEFCKFQRMSLVNYILTNDYLDTLLLEIELCVTQR